MFILLDVKGVASVVEDDIAINDVVFLHRIVVAIVVGVVVIECPLFHVNRLSTRIFAQNRWCKTARSSKSNHGITIFAFVARPRCAFTIVFV